jgi:hypothetical protein
MEIVTNEGEYAPHRPCRYIGAEISGAVLLYPPHHLDAGPLLVHSQLQIGVALVVTKEDIIPGPVLFDQVRFKNEGLKFIGGHGILEVGDLTDHGRLPGVESGRSLEVTPDPISQLLGLPHVEDRVVPVPEEIDAGLIRDEFESFGDTRHSPYFLPSAFSLSISILILPASAAFGSRDSTFANCFIASLLSFKS